MFKKGLLNCAVSLVEAALISRQQTKNKSMNIVTLINIYCKGIAGSTIEIDGY